MYVKYIADNNSLPEMLVSSLNCPISVEEATEQFVT